MEAVTGTIDEVSVERVFERLVREEDRRGPSRDHIRHVVRASRFAERMDIMRLYDTYTIKETVRMLGLHDTHELYLLLMYHSIAVRNFGTIRPRKVGIARDGGSRRTFNHGRVA